MKCSLVFVALAFVALVATSTANASALPADATKPTSASEVESPNVPKEHGVKVSQGPRMTGSNPYETVLTQCKKDACAGCQTGAKGVCVEQCESWASSPESVPKPTGC